METTSKHHSPTKTTTQIHNQKDAKFPEQEDEEKVFCC